jgi:hypothetical protein
VPDPKQGGTIRHRRRLRRRRWRRRRLGARRRRRGRLGRRRGRLGRRRVRRLCCSCDGRGRHVFFQPLRDLKTKHTLNGKPASGHQRSLQWPGGLGSAGLLREHCKQPRELAAGAQLRTSMRQARCHAQRRPRPRRTRTRAAARALRPAWQIACRGTRLETQHDPSAQTAALTRLTGLGVTPSQTRAPCGYLLRLRDLLLQPHDRVPERRVRLRERRFARAQLRLRARVRACVHV